MNKRYKNWMGLLLITAVCLFMTAIPVQAEEIMESQEQRSILDVIKKQGDMDATSAFLNKELYSEELEGYDFTNDICLKVCFMPFWYYNARSTPIEELLFGEEVKERYWCYVVFREKPFLLDGKVNLETEQIYHIMSSTRYDSLPTFLDDIVNSTIYDSPLNTTEEDFTKVVCFDSTNSYHGIFVFYIKEGNSIVRFYEDYESPATEYTLDDFKEYRVAYDDYISAYENNYDEFGHPLIGGNPSFAEFVTEYNEQKQEEQKQEAKPKQEWIIYVAVAVLGVGFVITTSIIAKRKEKRRNC